MIRVLVLALALVSVTIMAVLQPAGALAGTTRLTVDYRSCPRGYTRIELYATCRDHPERVESSLRVFTTKPYAAFDGRADADGALVFDLPPGTYEIEGPPGEYVVDRALSCGSSGDRSQVTETARLPALTAGDDVACAYYVVPEAPFTGSDPWPNAVLFALGCDQDPGPVRTNDAVFPPTGCAFQPGVRMTLTAPDARPGGDCVTGDTGFCQIPKTFGSPVILIEDVSTIPAGYAPLANPILYGPATRGRGIINVPIAALPAPAAPGASLTVHSRVCPPGYEAGDYFNDCRGTPPSYRQTSFLVGEYGGSDRAAQVIDADGNARFDGLVAERYELLPGLPAKPAGVFVFCSQVETPGVEFPTAAIDRGLRGTAIDLAADDQILCDVYTLPA